MNIVLKKPIVSEKSMKMAASGWYTFLVDKDARKPVIAKAIEEQFSVNVVGIKTMNYKEQKKMQRGKRTYFTVSGYKKAVVSLKTGQTIGLFIKEEAKKEEKPVEKIKEKKSLLKGTKVKIEKEGVEGDK